MTAQEMMGSWQKFVQPDQKPGIIHPDSVLELLRACEDLRWNHDKSTSIPIRNRKMPTVQFAGPNEGIFVLSFQSGLSEKWWREAMECLCFFAKHTRQNCRHDVTERKKMWHPNHGPTTYAMWSRQFFTFNLNESSSLWNQDASRNIHRIRAEFWRRLDPTLDYRGLARH